MLLEEDTMNRFCIGAVALLLATLAARAAEDGRRIQIAWMNGGQYPKMPFNQQMSFPCEMKLRTFPEGLRICRTPVKEIELLHDKETAWTDLTLKEGENPLKDMAGDLLEIRAEIETGDATQVVLTVRGEPIRLSTKDKKLSCLGRDGPLETVGGRVKLQVLADRTLLEVFGNDGRVAMTTCFLPRPGKTGLALSATGVAARIVAMKVWTLKSAWGEGK